MKSLPLELQNVLADALAAVGSEYDATGEIAIVHFDEVMAILGDYLMTNGIAPGGELNALGHRIEDLEDRLAREKMGDPGSS